MTEKKWIAAEDGHEILEFIRVRSSDRKMRLLAVAGCRAVWTWMTDERSRTAVETAERYADGLATAEEIRLAGEHAYEAAVVHRHGSVNDFDLCCRALGATGSAINAPSEVLSRSGSRLRRLILSEVYGNPFRPVAFAPEWRTSTAVALAAAMYDARAFGNMPILADALEEAGCDDADVLAHCRNPDGVHVRGCWVVDLVLGKS